MKIYTKKGDNGDTSLLYGAGVSKDDIAPEAYGSVDELVASLGLIRAESKLSADVKDTILRIQRELFIVGAELATDKSKRKKLSEGKTLVTEEMIINLEKDIDNLTEKNGLPNFFVVPGENIISAKLDWSRAISRRAERKCVTWYKTLDMSDSKVLIYLNRLSDLLWMMARDFEKDWTPSN